MSYFTYILHCADDTLYTGWTTDVIRRVDEHNTSSKWAKYTHSRRPVALAYSEFFETESAARKREYALKKLTRREKLTLIQTKS